ncbi:hypothetical protein NMS_2644 [Nonlabens marinus S1-08]|uniref:Uncharacterized protein n=1 Tax=Nonlabens marinus S1-08 TaxID=1454201 RepID=W8VWV2_9FLAO|nr:hypothetical protein NMS_2644 [Nonlabens marinus S1-08]
MFISLSRKRAYLKTVLHQSGFLTFRRNLLEFDILLIKGIHETSFIFPVIFTDS